MHDKATLIVSECLISRIGEKVILTSNCWRRNNLINFFRFYVIAKSSKIVEDFKEIILKKENSLQIFNKCAKIASWIWKRENNHYCILTFTSITMCQFEGYRKNAM